MEMNCDRILNANASFEFNDFYVIEPADTFALYRQWAQTETF